MQSFILSIHLILAVALVIIVLMQRSEGGALGIGGGGGGLFNVRGTGDLLTRTTAILAACFMATSLLLTILSGSHRQASSLFDEQSQENEIELEIPDPGITKGATGDAVPLDAVPLAQ